MCFDLISIGWLIISLVEYFCASKTVFSKICSCSLSRFSFVNNRCLSISTESKVRFIISLFIYANPIVAVLSLLVAFDLIRRSSLTTGIDALARYAPTEQHKMSQFTAFNQFPYTLEQEVVKKMAPILQGGYTMSKATYKPVLEQQHDAALIR